MKRYILNGPLGSLLISTMPLVHQQLNLVYNHLLDVRRHIGSSYHISRNIEGKGSLIHYCCVCRLMHYYIYRVFMRIQFEFRARSIEIERTPSTQFSCCCYQREKTRVFFSFRFGLATKTRSSGISICNTKILYERHK